MSPVSWTTPKTWVAGTTPTAADFNTYIRDNAAVLRANAAPTSALGNMGATQTIDMSGLGSLWVTGTLNANCAVTVASMTEGSFLRLFVTQDVTGSRTLTVNNGGSPVSCAITATALASSVVNVYLINGAVVPIVAGSGVSGGSSPTQAVTREVYIANNGTVTYDPTTQRSVDVLFANAWGTTTGSGPYTGSNGQTVMKNVKYKNPAARCLLYMNGPGCNSVGSQTDKRFWGCGVTFERATTLNVLAKDTTGAQITSYFFGNAVGDFRQQAFITEWINTATAILTTYPLDNPGQWDGVFMDDGTVGTALNYCRPKNPSSPFGGTANPPAWVSSDDQWSGYYVEFIEQVAQALHNIGKLLYINLGPRMDISGRYVPAVFPMIDGALDELWIGSNAGTLPADTTPQVGGGMYSFSWRSGVQLHKLLNRGGVDSCVRFDKGVTGTSADDFALASYLLVSEPASSAWTLTTSYGSLPAVSGLAKAASLGAPLAPYTQASDTLYRRNFAHGNIVVNPWTTTISGLASKTAQINITG